MDNIIKSMTRNEMAYVLFYLSHSSEHEKDLKEHLQTAFDSMEKAKTSSEFMRRTLSE